MKKLLFLFGLVFMSCSKDEPITYVEKCGVITFKEAKQKPNTIGDFNKIYYFYVDGFKVEVTEEEAYSYKINDTYCRKVRSDLIYF